MSNISFSSVKVSSIMNYLIETWPELCAGMICIGYDPGSDFDVHQCLKK